MDEVCDRCRFGRISTTTACYIGKVGSIPLIMPATLAYVCDICGWIEYDAATVQALDNLVQQPETPPTMICAKSKRADSVSTIVTVK